MRRRRDVARLLAGDGGGDAVINRVSEFSATGSASGFDVAEAEAEIGVGFVDGNADEGVAVVHADLGDVARVVADRNRLPDERGKCRGEVALPLEVNSVSLHDAALGDGEQEAVELFEAVGHSWKPAVRDPRVPRRYSELAVRACVVHSDEPADRVVEGGQLESGVRVLAAGS